MVLSREEINKRYREKKTKSEGKVYYRRWTTPNQADQFDSVLAGESKVVKNKKKGKDDANT
jgi:hypothetical protein